ncbi:LOW QUALITY PROTEIN: GTP-binding protein Rhes-like [Amphiura filiformis]|uniref:LOW QUALITY PROTEIN: GTP-binding protein Rhes-like n=1 Tax=Amphiura filiformis TaxID=82378 RepID=UPI003B20E7B6
MEPTAHLAPPVKKNYIVFFVVTGDVFLLVYGVDSRESFQEVLRLRQHIIDIKRSNGPKAVPMVIAGNKSDKVEEREVKLEDVRRSIGSARRCTCLEASARDHLNVDMLFQALFENARLPSEMTPSQHRKISASSSPVQSTRGLSLRRRNSDACGVISPNARRPSLKSDLMQVSANALRNGHRDDDDVDDDVDENGERRRKRGCEIQ